MPDPREFERVRKQVGDDLNKVIGVHPHVERFRSGVQPDAQAIPVGKPTIGLNRLLHQHARRAPLKIVIGWTGFKFLAVQDVVEQANEPTAIVIRNLNEAHGGGRERPARTADQETERAGNRRHRRAQLMAHRDDEFVLQPLEMLALADVDDGAKHPDTAIDPYRVEADFDREPAAVFAPPEKLPADSHAAGAGPQHIAAALNRVLWRALRPATEYRPAGRAILRGRSRTDVRSRR